MTPTQPQMPKGEFTVSGTFTMSILDDGRHAQIHFKFDPNDKERLEDWMTFAYCNDLVWRIHAMRGDYSTVWMSTVIMSLYRHLFTHITDEQYVVPGAE